MDLNLSLLSYPSLGPFVSADNPFLPQMPLPTVIGIGQNVPVRQLLSDIHMQTCDTVTKHPITLHVLQKF